VLLRGARGGSALGPYAAARWDESIDNLVAAAGLNVVSVERGDQAWTVTVDGGLPPACPRCGALSNSRHSTYSRTLRDLSAQGAPVIVRARLGRWRCRNLKCDRRIFAERLPGLAASLSRQTSRLAEIVRLLGHSAGGRPSERLMRRLGMPVSDTTILGQREASRGSSNPVSPPRMFVAPHTAQEACPAGVPRGAGHSEHAPRTNQTL
jgi:zinc-finger of transposase IS204/IS1001/IS1096/IS1165